MKSGLTMIEVVAALALLSLIVAASVPLVANPAGWSTPQLGPADNEGSSPRLELQAEFDGKLLRGELTGEGEEMRIEWDIEGWRSLR